MGIFQEHKHSWKEVERFCALPTSNPINFNVDRGVDVRQIIFGVTTIHFVCACGEHKFVEILGKKV